MQNATRTTLRAFSSRTVFPRAVTDGLKNLAQRFDPLHEGLSRAELDGAVRWGALTVEARRVLSPAPDPRAVLDDLAECVAAAAGEVVPRVGSVMSYVEDGAATECDAGRLAWFDCTASHASRLMDLTRDRYTVRRYSSVPAGAKKPLVPPRIMVSSVVETALSAVRTHDRDALHVARVTLIGERDLILARLFGVRAVDRVAAGIAACVGDPGDCQWSIDGRSAESEGVAALLTGTPPGEHALSLTAGGAEMLLLHSATLGHQSDIARIALNVEILPPWRDHQHHPLAQRLAACLRPLFCDDRV